MAAGSTLVESRRERDVGLVTLGQGLSHRHCLRSIVLGVVMAQTAVEQGRLGGNGGRARAARVGAVATVLAMALVVYGTYGDSQASDSQKSSMPFVLVVAAVLALVTFGVLVPLALRAVDAGTAGGRRWAIGLATASVVGLVVFWSGLPLIVGSAAVLVGRAGAESGQDSRAFTSARVLGFFAVGASILVTILGNVLH